MRTRPTYSDVQLLVRRAQARRASAIGELVASGLSVLARAVIRGGRAIAVPWRRKQPAR